MNDPEAFTLLASLVSVAIGLYLTFWCYIDYRVDAFRQSIFQLRDQLFDDARAGKVDFDDPAYRNLRHLMNGFIRFSHRLSFPHLMVFMAIVAGREYQIPESLSVDKMLDKNLEALTEEQQKLVREYKSLVDYRVAEHVVLSSPLLMVSVLIPVGFLAAGKNRVEKWLNKQPLKSSMEGIDSAAFVSTGRL